MKLGLRSMVMAGLVLAAVMAAPGPAQAATSQDFGPRIVTGIPNSATQLVIPMATIESKQLPAGANAYVYSELKAQDADGVNLIDNEIRCSGAGGSDVVLGENVLPPTGDPAHQKITIVNRFLVTAKQAGTITCTLYLRTSSTGDHVAKETVSGTVRFTPDPVPGDVTGAAIQKSLPSGNTTLSSTVVAPVIDRDIPLGFSFVDVIADTEFHWCASTTVCAKSPDNYSKARFALTATTSGGATCASAPVVQTDETVQQGVNHAAIPLYTRVAVKPGCTHLHAQVTGTYLAGNVGLVGGGVDLTDSTGSADTHPAAMTHMFAVPRTS
ncbi:hypothetical protein [Amycolatopsis sp. FDAARGOS 1241]|uniref:hypothetical protein n=1 Tax=Amycolatopsis sp. FDAARGOS 1241 TaxID=2778070 RepID=UPI00195029E8|nr:hypothetical protein [Amycolatopsis sp. FDAARGOS 1241]QRP46249.1 hypothetical protein I6J71_45750 [Amycolatopsis sp. FDAARGOS 1241]